MNREAQREPPAIDVAHHVFMTGWFKFSGEDLAVPRPDWPWTYVANFRPSSLPPASTTYCNVTLPHESRTVTSCSPWISPRGRGDKWSHRREAMDPPPATIRLAASGQAVQALFDPGSQSRWRVLHSTSALPVAELERLYATARSECEGERAP